MCSYSFFDTCFHWLQIQSLNWVNNGNECPLCAKGCWVRLFSQWESDVVWSRFFHSLSIQEENHCETAIHQLFPKPGWFPSDRVSSLLQIMSTRLNDRNTFPRFSEFNRSRLWSCRPSSKDSASAKSELDCSVISPWWSTAPPCWTGLWLSSICCSWRETGIKCQSKGKPTAVKLKVSWKTRCKMQGALNDTYTEDMSSFLKQMWCPQNTGSKVDQKRKEYNHSNHDT